MIGVGFFFVLCCLIRKRFFEAAIDLAQFPEDRNEEDRDYKQQERNDHLQYPLAETRHRQGMSGFLSAIGVRDWPSF